MEFEVKNINHDEEARRDLVEEYKSTATPTVVWQDGDDEEVIIGFDKSRLKDLIENKAV